MIGAQLPITGEMDAESLALHQNVLETAHNAYVAIGELGTVRTWNSAAERIFGWPKPTAVGQPLVSLIIPERYRAAHTTGLARYLQSGQGSVIGRRLELAALRADGSEFPIEISISATEEGGRFSFHAFIADVTERHARERETHLLATIVRESADAIIVKGRRRHHHRVEPWRRAALRLQRRGGGRAPDLDPGAPGAQRRGDQAAEARAGRSGHHASSRPSACAETAIASRCR